MNWPSTAAAIETGGRIEADGDTVARFVRRGFADPLRIFSDTECRQIVAHVRNRSVPPPSEWSKGRAVTDPFFYSLAVRPRLIAELVPLLGDDIILWGASVVSRKPNQVHWWHTDIESSGSRGGFVSVWIGIENTSRESGLELIPGSHRFGKPIQQVAHERGLARDRLSAATALDLAREFDPDAVVVQPEIKDGEALIFEGRLWHGSFNTRTDGTRSALLLQYAAARQPVRIPDFTQLEWPFRIHDEQRPPVIVVHGQGDSAINRLALPPQPDQGTSVSGLVKPLKLPLAESPSRERAHYHVLRGQTFVLEEMESHVSVLSPGRCPHPPHIHPEEEILVVLDGEADIVLSDDEKSSNERVVRLRPGAFTYYPSGQYHTIRNSSDAPITYLMFKWRAADPAAAGTMLGTGIFHYEHLLDRSDVKNRKHIPIFEGATAHLGKLHAHLSIVPPQAGYAPHVDAHDVAMVVLTGKVETLGQTVEPHGIVYCAAGTSHGMKNVGSEPARYLVFEFHGNGAGTLPRPRTKRPLISTRKLQKRIAALTGWVREFRARGWR